MVTTVTRLWQFLIYLKESKSVFSTMLDVQLYCDGQVIYRITGKLYGYLISVVFCNQLRITEIKIAEYYVTNINV
jgi:hypothetical protein